MSALSKSERARLLAIAGDEWVGATRTFENAVDRFRVLLKDSSYSDTMITATTQAIKEFRAFMEVNAFPYSQTLASEWLRVNRGFWSNGKHLTYRRTLKGIESVLLTGALPVSRLLFKIPEQLPEWFGTQLKSYVEERRKEGCAQSTLKMIMDSCNRLAMYLETIGCSGWDGVTPQVLKGFHTQDTHATAAGKNAYSLKIRHFLVFLARTNMVSETLMLALPTDYAVKNSIIEILSDSQIDAIYAYRRSAVTRDELRKIAIVLMGLRMGLRASDIVGLRLQDICWQDGTISIEQKKTGVQLKLPLTVDAGNSLWRYIKERPVESNSSNIFVRHRAPFCKLDHCSANKELRDIMAIYGFENIGGFHITRRTFASKLLSAGNDTIIISEALGQSGTGTVSRYLSTDKDGMRKCAVGLNGIEYMGHKL